MRLLTYYANVTPRRGGGGVTRRRDHHPSIRPIRAVDRHRTEAPRESDIDHV